MKGPNDSYRSTFSRDEKFTKSDPKQNEVEQAVWNEFSKFRHLLVKEFNFIHERCSDVSEKVHNSDLNYGYKMNELGADIQKVKDMKSGAPTPSYIHDTQAIRKDLDKIKVDMANANDGFRMEFDEFKGKLGSTEGNLAKLTTDLAAVENFQPLIDKAVEPLIKLRTADIDKGIAGLKDQEAKLQDMVAHMADVTQWRESLTESNFNIAEGQFNNLKAKVAELEVSTQTTAQILSAMPMPPSADAVQKAADGTMAGLMQRVENLEGNLQSQILALKCHLEGEIANVRKPGGDDGGCGHAGSSSSLGQDCKIVYQHCHHVETLIGQMRAVGVTTAGLDQRIREIADKNTELQVTMGQLRAICERGGQSGVQSTQDPWFQGSGTGQGIPGAAAAAPQVTPPGIAETHTTIRSDSLAGPLGPLGNVSSGKIFDDKIALDNKYQYSGSKDHGPQWRERVRGFFISKSPILHRLLPWAEAQDQRTITTEMISTVIAGRASREDIEMLNISVWGFLRTCVTGTAETVHGSGEAMNGLEAWRRLIRHIDWGASIHLEELRTAVRHITLKPIRKLEEVAVGVLEFERAHKKYKDAGGALPQEQEMKSDLLAILPPEMREHLLLRSTDEQITFIQFKDFIVTQSARIMVARGKSPMVAAVDESQGAEAAYDDQMSEDDLGELLAFAQRNGFDRFRNKRFPAKNGSSGAPVRRPPGGQPAEGYKQRCVNCGRLGHTKDECRQPAVPMSERPCFKCGQKGHTSRNCKAQPSGAGGSPQRRLAAVDHQQDNGADGHSFGCFMLSHQEDGWQRVSRGQAPRPKPQGYTIGDAIKLSKTFKALAEENEEKDNSINRRNNTCTDNSCTCTDNSCLYRIDHSFVCTANSINTVINARVHEPQGRNKEQGKLLRQVNRASTSPRAATQLTANGATAPPPTATQRSERAHAKGHDTAIGQPLGRPTTNYSDSTHNNKTATNRSNHAGTDSPNSLAQDKLTQDLRLPHCSGGYAANVLMAVNAQYDPGLSSREDAEVIGSLNAQVGDDTEVIGSLNAQPDNGQPNVEVIGSLNAQLDNGQPINVLEYKPEEGEVLLNDEMVELEVTQDSGSITNVLNPHDLPSGCNIVAGQNRPFVGANGGIIKNHGTSDTEMAQQDGRGKAVKCRWTCADVTRPLLSTGVTCDSGYEVLYTDTQALVVPKGALSKHLAGVLVVQQYTRQGKGLYTTRMRVRASVHKPADFPRQSVSK